MGKELSKNSNIVIKELQAKIKSLNKENNSLAAKQEALLLINSIYKVISRYKDVFSLLNNTLQEVADLQKLPLCCFCKIKGDEITVLHSGSQLSGTRDLSVNIQLGKKNRKEISGDGIVFKLADNKNIKIKLKSGKKIVPLTHLFLVPVKTPFLSEGFFLFADDKKTNRFSSISPQLQQIVDMILERIDLIAMPPVSKRNSLNEKALPPEDFDISSLTERLTDIVFLIDSSGTILYISHAIYDLFGWTQEEITGRKIMEFLVESEIPKVAAIFSEIMNTRTEARNMVYLMKRKDGSTFYGEINASIVSTSSGIRAQGVVRDVSQRRQMDNDIYIKERAVAASFDGIAISDFGGKLTYVNDSFLQMWGYTYQEAINLNAADLDADKNEITKILNDIKEKGVSSGESIAKRKDGTLFNIQYIANLVLNPSGEPIAMLSTFIDITERKRISEELIKTDTRLKSIFSTAPIGIGLVVDRVFTEVNDTLCRILGYSSKELLGKSARMLYLTDEEFNFVGEEKYRQIDEMGIGTVETKWLRKNGEVIDILLSSTPLNPKDTLAGISFTALDITEKKLAEQALKESQLIFTQFMEHSPYYVFFKDKNMKSLKLSRNYEAMLGRPLDELLNKTMDELFPSELAKKMITDDLNILNGGKQVDIEEELNGRFYSTIKFPIYHNGEPKYLAGYTIDITERKQTEQVLLTQNDYLKALQETSLDLISELDLDPLLESIVNRAGHFIGASSGFLSLISPDGSHMICKLETNFIEREKTDSIIMLGEGLAGKVWETGKPMIIEDYSKWAGRRTEPGVKYTGSSLAVPLFSGSTFLGVLGFANEHSSNRIFNQDSLNRLTMFTRFATIAIENAQLFSKANLELSERKQAEELLHYQNDYLKALHETTLDLIAQLDLDLLLEKIVKRAVQFIGASSGFLAVPTPDGNHIMEKIRTGVFDTKGKLAIINRGEGLVGKAWETGQPIIINDYYSWPGRRPGTALDSIGAIVAIPLYSGTTILGVLGLSYDRESNRIFSQNVLDKLTMFARLATIAIENVKLFAEANKEIEERKIAEEALRDSEEKFRTMFNQSPIGIELYSADGTQIAANKASLDMFGISDFSELKYFNLFNGTSLSDEIKNKLRNGEPVVYQAAFDFEKVKRLNQYKTSKSGVSYLDYIITPLSDPEKKSNFGYLLHVQDITQRKFAEKEINMLAHSLKSIHECVSITDIENNLIFVNQSFLDTYGFTEEEIIGKNIDIVGSPNNRAGIFDEILSSTLNGGWLGETINKRKDGTEFPISLSTSIIRDKEGRILGLIGVAQDITERRQTEEEIAIYTEELITLNRIITQSANQLDSRMLLESALDEALQICGLEGGTVCVITSDQKLHLAVERNTSEATKKDLLENNILIGDCLCGNCALEQEPLILHNHSEILEYSTREAQRGEDIRFHAAFPIVTKGISIGVLCVFTYTDKKPSVRSLELIETMTAQIALTLENANLYEQVQKQLADLEEEISERKFYEENLRKNEKNLSITLNSIGDAVISTDEDGRIVRMNPVAEKLCGWKYENAKGKLLAEVFNIINAHTRKSVPNPVKFVMETGKIVGMANHTVLISKDGKEYQISDSAAPIKNEEGVILGIVLVFSDVTEKYAIQEALRESEATLIKAELFGKFGNWELDLTTKTISASKGAVEIYGMSEDKCDLSVVQNYVLPEYRKHQSEALENLIKNNIQYDVEFKIKRFSDGRIVDIHSTAKFNPEKQIVFGVIQDITERKAAELKLKESEERYKRITDGLTDYLITVKVKDGKAIETTHNEACLAVTGYTPAEFKADPFLWIKMVVPEDREGVAARFINILQGKDFSPIEHRITCKNGSVRWISDATIPKFDSNGNLISYDGVIKDITERKLAEEQIRNSEKEYRDLFEQASDSILILKPEDGLILEVNSKACLTYGYSKEEFVGKNLKDVSGQIDNDMKFIKDILNGSGVNNYETLHFKNDMTPINGLVSASVIEYKGEKAIQSFMLDITERKRAEQEIISQRNNFEQLFINSPIAIAIMDQYDHIIHINQSFTSLFGYSFEEAVGQDLNDLVVPNQEREEGVLLSRQAHYGKPISKESFRKKKDGSLLFVQIAGIPIEIDEKRIGIYAMYIDLTHRMRAEQETIKSREIAEQSNKMKSEFLAQISHEIRSPINIITSNISLINEDMKDNINSEVQDCFNSIYFATKRIIRTIDLILNMSELQTGSYRPILTTLDVDLKVLNLLYGEFQKPARDKGINLIYRKEINTSQIIADEYSITQIFANLIDNAIKYTKKGSVEIILGRNKEGDTMVEIKDTGIGINKDFLPRLFQPFNQEEQGYTRSYEGNGLGLSLVKKYCDINNARIEYESEKNVGSIFRVVFDSDKCVN